MRIRRLVLSILAPLALLGCGSSADDEIVDVVFIGTPGELAETGLRLAPGAAHLRAATAEGLVSLDAAGNVVPAVAERWIVTDDGLSYIFRLRNSEWPDGTPIDSEDVRAELRRTISNLRGTSLGLDLDKISEVRAMTGRVIEIRLKSPMPDLLQILAQPELGLRRNGRGMGPMAATLAEEGYWLLEPLPPEARGLPQNPAWADRTRQLRLRALPAREAIAAFDSGAADLVLNGTLANLPLADVGALSRGTVRLDAALGLFGLQVHAGDSGEEGGEGDLLADAARREALAMAIDRETLLAPFNIGGWVPTTRILAPGLPDDIGTIDERWTDLSIEERRALAAQRIAGWAGGEEGGAARATIHLPPGPGSDTLFAQLAQNLATIGVTLVRVEEASEADLTLVDRVARYGGARWFLNQFNCGLDRGLCVPEADARVAEAVSALDPMARAALFAEAEAELAAANVYIPLGAPIRWSLLRGGVEGFEENRWSIHPLFPLALRPI